jgi:fucokinase
MKSGGGTIAALAEAHIHSSISNPTILICHAGGESTRCPTQIALGKAWTSLPIVYKHEPDESGAIFSTKVSNPTSLLIEGLSVLFQDVPRGSVIVAASDVLLLFDDDKLRTRRIDFSNFSRVDNRVIGLAVPAPLATAKNHGVFVVDSECSNDGIDCDIRSTYKVLQKPTEDEMKEMTNPSCLIQASSNVNDHDGELLAWIDTGVIAFLPDAAAILRELSTTTLKTCTRQGLQQIYNESQKDDTGISLEAFAKRTAPKICLYSDILHSLRTIVAQTKRHCCDDMMNTLHQAFSALELLTCTISSGSFAHLGTTRELLDFLSPGASDMRARTSAIRSCGASLGLGLTRRAVTLLNCFAPHHVQSSTVLNTCINGNTGSNNNTIGCGTVLEHCLIDKGSDSSFAIQIGERCIVSGIRPNIKGSLHVPSGICLQLLPLRAEAVSASSFKSAFICLSFGVDDDIKASPPNTLFGVDFGKLLQCCGLNESDLWDPQIEKKMIWNAKIMPVLVEDEDSKLDLSFLTWIDYFINHLEASVIGSEPIQSLPEFLRWKQSPRVSISDLRQCIDPGAEILHRKKNMSEISFNFDRQFLALAKRRNDPCNTSNVIELVSNTRMCDPFQFSEVRRVLLQLESVIHTSFKDGNFDIVGRCFMTMALLLSDVQSCLNKKKLESDGTTQNISVSHDEDEMLASLVGSSGSGLSKILSIKDGKIGPYNLDLSNISRCCNFLEKAAAVMTSICVRGKTSHDCSLPISAPISVGSTVVASAPARIDLSGGWSDTPPISYEHGGAVACLAVTVDGRRPLQAKCRFVLGMDGILLRTESRNLANDELVASSEVGIQCLNDMRDYNNPQAACSLLKCALIYLGLVSTDDIVAHPSACIQSYLNKFCQQEKLNVKVGLEVVSLSLLPTGSGMGGSSILGGCVLSAVAKCVGVTFEDDSLIHAVLMLESMLTTGGGW